MAKIHKNLDEAVSNAVDELLKDYQSAMKDAVTFAVVEAQKDFMFKARTCLEEYYDNYDPSSYHRTYSLDDAFLPYVNVKYGKDKVSGQVGVEYDASRLTTYVVGSKDYGNRDEIDDGKNIIPINEWILKNYLNGIHPITDGSRIPGEAIYFEIIDSVSPNQKMETFIEEYGKTFDKNVLIHLLGQIDKKL